jgi:hypothetical protein
VFIAPKAGGAVDAGSAGFTSNGGAWNGLTDVDDAPPWGTRFNLSGGSDGDWIAWAVALRAGTYRLTFWSFVYDGAGIITFALNTWGGTQTPVDITDAPYGASGGSADCYAAAPVLNQQFDVCDDLVIPADGQYSIYAYVDGKNPASSGFVTNLNAILLERISA